MNNYVFINSYDNILNKCIFEKYKHYNSIHINFIDSNSNNLNYEYYDNIFSLIRKGFINNEIYIYAYNIKMAKAAKKNNLLIHYCFKNSNLSIKDDFFKLMEKDLNSEVFWILDNNILDVEIFTSISWLKDLNRAVCPYFSGLLTNQIDTNDHEKIRDYIKNIHTYFKNPLFFKEKSLTTTNWNFNEYIEQKNNVLYSKKLIMGIFGDIFVDNSEDSSIQKINLKTLLRTKDCSSCSYLENCKERGIGYIIYSLKLKGCCSYKLFN